MSNEQVLHNLAAQAEAYKQLFQESVNSCLQLRTKFILLEKSNKQLNDSIAALKKSLEEKEKEFLKETANKASQKEEEKQESIPCL